MKNLLLIIGIVACTSGFAQEPASKIVTDTTSAKPQKLTPSLLKLTKGTSMMPANDIVANIARSKEFSMLYNAILAAGLSETLKSTGPITFFAPDDNAFKKLSPGKLDSLLKPERKYDLIAILSYHAIAGKITSKNIAQQISSNKGLATFTTIAGSKLNAKLDENRNIILIDENGGKSVITKFDVEQNNGLIHIVNAVLIPKPKTI
jgi:uncharacterized surface protein with fasciclin (FAS1) repeats